MCDHNGRDQELLHAAPIHEELRIEIQREEEAEEHQRAPLQQAGPQLQQAPARLQQDIQALRMDEVEVLDGPIFQAPPAFAHGEANLSRQRDREQIERSRKKAGREQATRDQEQADRVRAGKLNARMNALSRNDSEELLQKTVLSEEQNIYNALRNAGPRADLTGHYRRKNAGKFAESNPQSGSVQKAARKDVENLVNNLRRDICLECDPSLPEDTADYADAFYFRYKFGEAAIEKKARALNAMRQDGRTPEGEITAARSQMKKLEGFVLFLKMSASNTSITVGKMARDIRARELARRQILDEGITPYHQLMVGILDREIAELQRNYNEAIEGLRTCNHTEETPRGAAQIAAQAELTRLRRQMKADGVTEEEKEALTDQAYAVFENFNYEGDAPVI